MFRDIHEVKEANNRAGYFFFSPDTMRFFNSRILGKLYGGRWFITSERGPYSFRRYTIRQANADGSITTVKEFGKYSTASAARAAAARIVKGAE